MPTETRKNCRSLQSFDNRMPLPFPNKLPRFPQCRPDPSALCRPIWQSVVNISANGSERGNKIEIVSLLVEGGGGGGGKHCFSSTETQSVLLSKYIGSSKQACPNRSVTIISWLVKTMITLKSGFSKMPVKILI